MRETDLVAVQEDAIAFYNDKIPLLRTAHTASVDALMIPLRPICESMGISWSAQFERVQRDEVLSDLIRSVRVTRTEGVDRTLICIPLRYLPGWLFGISAARIQQPETRQRVLRFQREAYDVLWEHYQHALTQPIFADTGAQAAYDQARALAHLARQQVALEATAGQVSTQLQTLELSLAGMIDTHATMQLSKTIKEVADMLRQQGNQQAYQHVYAALIERYAISSYQQLTPEQGQDAQAWLRAWGQQLKDC